MSVRYSLSCRTTLWDSFLSVFGILLLGQSFFQHRNPGQSSFQHRNPGQSSFWSVLFLTRDSR
ncbi:hypothetical protein RhiirA1_486012 [Rhizophagus irregularis]|uniref:Uncharacterized protein n=1 Tax=Rhizophagus irregularis TaxID=588596 RepID=A0A2N0QHM2_9GLOM|nr:hypothetical protein RhiirA1_486012 [Rhizophagus irregularis]